MFGTLQLGDVLRNKYRLERVIGQGGMATVVAAFHIHLEQRVAIKFLRPELVERKDAVERFLREARAASKLEDASIARVIDVDTLADGTPFIVMEYLEGEDLAELVRRRSVIPFAEATAYVREACAAVGEAHAAGIIHRDLKPSNLFLATRRSGESAIKVLDFGISQIVGDTRITQTAAGMGSMEYMSPEQMQSAHNVDARTDIWSLGVTLYELSTGMSPFHAEGVGAVCAAVMAGTPLPPRRFEPGIPPGLEAVILRCLEKDPARRFASVAELAAALAPFAAPPPSLRRSGAYHAVAGGPPPAPPSAPKLTFLAEAPAGVAAPPPPGPPPPASFPGQKLTAFAAGPPSSTSPASAPGSTSAPPGSATRPSLPGAAAPALRGPPMIVVAAVGVVALLLVIVAFVVGFRNAGGGGVKPGRYAIQGDMLHDTETRLTWQRRPGPGAKDWAGAKAYCASLGGGLRLPEVSELTGLLDFVTLDPPLDPEGFQQSTVDVFWTSSRSPSTEGAFLAVSFYDRSIRSISAGERYRVRCVH